MSETHHGARHVAIIMDGNGRWAKKRFLPRVAGHKAGVEAVRTVVRAAAEMGLEAMTLYAFSSENWKRPEEEVNDRVYHHRQDLETSGRIEILTDMTKFDAERLRYLIGQHARFTGSARAEEILADWVNYRGKFRKVMPVEYRRALKELAALQEEEPKLAVGA